MLLLCTHNTFSSRSKKIVNFRASKSWLDKWIFRGQVITFDNSTTMYSFKQVPFTTCPCLKLLDEWQTVWMGRAGFVQSLLPSLAHLCSRWAVVISQCLSFIVCRVASTIALKVYFSHTPKPMESKLGKKHRCRSKIAKIVPIGNPGWPQWQPSWKYIFRFSSWTKRPMDS